MAEFIKDWSTSAFLSYVLCVAIFLLATFGFAFVIKVQLRLERERKEIFERIRSRKRSG